MRVLIALLAISIVGYATPQRNPMGLTARIMLISDPSVKKEVKISKDQDKAIQKLMTDGAEEMKTKLPENFDMMNPLSHLEPKLLPILSEEQMLRLEGIYMQANTGFSLADARIAALVKLTDAQAEQVAVGTKAAQDALMESMTSGRVSNNTLKEMAKKRLEAGQNLLKVLDEAQTKIFNDALGKPFKFRS